MECAVSIPKPHRPCLTGYDPEWVRYCTYYESDTGLPDGITNPKRSAPLTIEFGTTPLTGWGEVNQPRHLGALPIW